MNVLEREGDVCDVEPIAEVERRRQGVSGQAPGVSRRSTSAMAFDHSSPATRLQEEERLVRQLTTEERLLGTT